MRFGLFNRAVSPTKASQVIEMQTPSHLLGVRQIKGFSGSRYFQILEGDQRIHQGENGMRSTLMPYN